MCIPQSMKPIVQDIIPMGSKYPLRKRKIRLMWRHIKLNYGTVCLFFCLDGIQNEDREILVKMKSDSA